MLPLIALLLVPDLHCPPDTGQLRWKNLNQSTGAYAVEVSVWDTNQDGKPSAGDLAHLDVAKRGEIALDPDERWYTLGEPIAKALSPDAVKATPICEARPAINAAPTALKQVKQLKRGLDAAYKPVIARQKRVAYLDERLLRWGKAICKDKKFRPHGAVAKELFAKASRQFDDLDDKTVRAAAHAAARHESLGCTKVAQEKLSF